MREEKKKTSIYTENSLCHRKIHEEKKEDNFNFAPVNFKQYRMYI